MEGSRRAVGVGRKREALMNAVPNTEAVAGIENIIALVRDRCQPLAAERAPLASALHRVLRESVCASEDQPAFDRSA